MTSISIEEIERDLPGCLQRVQAGEVLVLTQGNRPIAELWPVAVEMGERRPFGLCAGEFRVPDDFDAPLPEDTLRDFEA